jgi:RNase adapter protein RapZ
MLNVYISSFSYHYSDKSKLFNLNGGGHIFDSRCLANPGRLTEFKTLTGKDTSVVNWLESLDVVKSFYKNSKELTLISIHNYIERQFENLLVSYGCTGGQHRSVYLAEKLHQDLSLYKEINCSVMHLQENSWPCNIT